ncbi:putative inorganic phosphate cotransporter isoform X1 [Sitophilus oryzae]|nr:putative inorganic phosphate cotransporter isoform X1 [Sitophilus oryzae]
MANAESGTTQKSKVEEKIAVEDEKELDETSSCLYYRYVQVALLFFMMLFLFAIRNCFSVAIVAMTKNISSNPDVPTYTWTNQNIIISSFFWSYAALQFFAGHLAQTFGTRWFLFSTVLVNSVCCILIPFSAALLGGSGVMACRIMQGLFQGFMIPLVSNMLGRWAPIKETSTLNSVVFTGVYVGSISSYIITGYFSASSWGWPAAFYFFGSLGIVWCVFWLLYSAESPAHHTKISHIEKTYIQQSLGQHTDDLVSTRNIPWSAILTSLPYWSIVIAAIGESWGSTLLNSELPTYLSYAIGLDIQKSSVFTALPTVASLIVTLGCGPLASFAVNRGYISKINSRRFFHGYGSLALTVGLLVLPYLDDVTSIACVLTITVGSGSTVVCGHLINPVDISPRFAGVLMGFSNGAGQLVAILAPILVHFVVVDLTDKELWRIMFITAAVIIASTALFFIVFCKTERQWWDEGEKKETKSPPSGETNKAYEAEVTTT